ncbi:MAG: DUF1844 domain-containing protein [Desulfobacteraceae bacterium]|nr:DUF1844 domain-containing protein [Desulfobacteraceae bacterium]
MSKGNGFTMKEGAQESQAGEALPKIDFSSFILSLYSSGLVQLGKMGDPVTGEKSINFSLAQHTIDMIAMLEEKTRGNLIGDEENLLKNLLSEIRLAYVEAKG